MKKEILSIPTVTLALKAKKLLLKQGIKATVVNFSQIENKSGCAYGIEFDASNYFSVISALKESDIPYKYLKKD